MTAKSLATKGPKRVLTVVNWVPGVNVVRSMRRTALLPLNTAYRYLPSSDNERRVGSLPIGMGVPNAPVKGSMETMLLPTTCEAVLGTLA
jgi:hypothetical protein